MANLKIKALLAHLAQRSVRRTSLSYKVPALSAGAKGYWTISGAPTTGYTICIWAATSNIAVASNAGFRAWPLYIGGGNIYVAYQTTNAVSANTITLTLYVTTYAG